MEILPENLKQKIQYLNQLYCESLGWNNPGASSLWNEKQCTFFHEQTKELHHQIVDILGDDYGIIFVE